MDIRRATSEDLGEVVGLVAEFFAADGFSTGPALIAERVEALLVEPRAAVFLADHDTAGAVGVATVTTTFGIEHGWLAEIEDLYVRPSHRSAGTGTALVEAALTWAAGRGASECEVVVTPAGSGSRNGLVAWYAALGFLDTGRRVLSRPATG